MATGPGSAGKGHDFLRAITAFSKADADPTSANKAIRMGQIDYEYDPTDYLGGTMPRVLFDGESVISQKRYPVFSNYYPRPGDRVVLLPIGTTYAILGTCDPIVQDPKVDLFNVVGSDTWEKPSGARLIRVQVQGGGGSGGGAGTTVASQVSAGGGGAGGGYGESWFSANAIDQSVTVTVPAGGVGASGASGTAGGTASFGSYVSAAGGQTGGFLGASSTPAGNPGGNADGQVIVADIAIQGQGGGSAIRLGTNGAVGGMGGSSVLGGGARGLGIQTGVNQGVTGGDYGGGGSGACVGPGNAAATGGNGGIGCVIVTTYF